MPHVCHNGPHFFFAAEYTTTYSRVDTEAGAANTSSSFDFCAVLKILLNTMLMIFIATADSNSLCRYLLYTLCVYKCAYLSPSLLGHSEAMASALCHIGHVTLFAEVTSRRHPREKASSVTMHVSIIIQCRVLSLFGSANRERRSITNISNHDTIDARYEFQHT